VYRVILSNPVDYRDHPTEFTKEESERPATTAGKSSAEGPVAASALGGYNRTRALFGGGTGKLRTPGPFQALNFSVAESAQAHSENGDWAGTWKADRAALNTLDYRAGYLHSDVPAGNGRLRRGDAFIQASGVTKEFGSNHVAFRYGASLEGGNEQSRAINVPLPIGTDASSGFGALKIYEGMSLHGNHYASALSYGLQLGTAGASTDVGYLKHIANLSFVDLLSNPHDRPGEVHRPISIEAALAGGAIQRFGDMPLSQRFFGGDAPQNFIAGDQWKIQSGPLIRSIPENRFNAADALGGPIGGTSFWSLNSTFSIPVWGRPLVPRELATDPKFPAAIDFELNSVRELLKLTYQKDLPAFKTLLNNMKPLSSELAQLASDLKTLSGNVPPAVVTSLVASQSATTSAVRNVEGVLGSNPGSAGFLIKERLTKIEKALDALASELAAAKMQANSDAMAAHRKKVAALQVSLTGDLAAIDLTVPTQKADQDLKVVRPVLDTFLHDLNIVSISPVAVFDAARLWPDRMGTRYGPGMGVRLTIVTFNVAVGYAWNVNGSKTEGPGALFFSLDISDVFR